MTLAQGQWNELLQSSLDTGMQRLAEQLSERSREVLGSAEQKMAGTVCRTASTSVRRRFRASARSAVRPAETELEQEVGRARSSLAEIESTASRIKEYAAQLEAASHDTLNELHRRTGNILETQTRRDEPPSRKHRRQPATAVPASDRLRSTSDLSSARTQRWNRSSRRTWNAFRSWFASWAVAKCKLKKICGCIASGCVK